MVKLSVLVGREKMVSSSLLIITMCIEVGKGGISNGGNPLNTIESASRESHSKVGI